MNQITWLLLGGAAIILPLAIYATTLLLRLSRQRRRQRLAHQERIEKIVDSIRVIASAMEKGECDYSEGSIRLCNLLIAIADLGKPIDYASEYPGIHALYEAIREYPTHEARQQLDKRTRQQQDKERARLEQQHGEAIVTDITRLQQFNPA